MTRNPDAIHVRAGAFLVETSAWPPTSAWPLHQALLCNAMAEKAKPSPLGEGLLLSGLMYQIRYQAKTTLEN